jgi:hypothetical protein
VAQLLEVIEHYPINGSFHPGLVMEYYPSGNAPSTSPPPSICGDSREYYDGDDDDDAAAADLMWRADTTLQTIL